MRKATLIHHFLENSARQFPDKVALVHEKTRATYRQMNEQANNLANWLIDHGIISGDRVAILMENGLEYVIGYYAALKVGAVAVPLSTGLGPDGLKGLIEEITPRCIVAGSKFERVLKAAEIPTEYCDWFIIHSSKKFSALNTHEVFKFENVIAGNHSSNPELSIDSHMLRWQNTAQLKSFFSDDLRMLNGGLGGFIDRYNTMLPPDFLSWDPLSRAQYTESKIFLSNYLLSSQGDRMAMANSVEGRYPFLDHRVIELAAQIPVHYRINGLNEKFILKNAARNIIPDELIDRPKQPYRAPISRCFFGENSPDYVDELLSDENLKRTGYFENNKVQKLLTKCRRQQGELLSERENMALVGILSTQLVDHQFIRNFPAYSVEEPEDVKVYGEDQ